MPQHQGGEYQGCESQDAGLRTRRPGRIGAQQRYIQRHGGHATLEQESHNLSPTMSASTSEISPVGATPALAVGSVVPAVPVVPVGRPATLPALPALPALPRRTQQPAVSATAHKTHTPSAAVSLLAGAVAGGVEATVTYPFEFAKTRAQLQAGGTSSGSRNPFAAIAQVARADGVGAIYTGCSTLILGTAFKAGVRFLSFDAIRNRLVDDRGVLSPGRGILAGMLAGAVESVAAVTPTERIKTALIDDAKSSHRQFRGGFDATRSIMAAQGLPGLYRGLVSTTMKQSATSAVRMGSYNVLKEASKKNSLPQNSGTTFAIGALAGTITVYATQPFDTIKTRAQSARGASTAEAFRSVLMQSGVKGFWSGSTMRLGRLVFSGGIVFTVYEKVAALLSRPS